MVVCAFGADPIGEVLLAVVDWLVHAVARGGRCLEVIGLALDTSVFGERPSCQGTSVDPRVVANGPSCGEVLPIESGDDGPVRVVDVVDDFVPRASLAVRRVEVRFAGGLGDLEAEGPVFR